MRAIARGIDLPTAITGAVLPGDAFERLFIATQPGEILYQVNGGFDTFLDIGDRVIRLGAGGGGYDERGLLGLAFHPEFRGKRSFLSSLFRPRNAGAGSASRRLSSRSVPVGNFASFLGKPRRAL